MTLTFLAATSADVFLAANFGLTAVVFFFIRDFEAEILFASASFIQAAGLAGVAAFFLAGAFGAAALLASIFFVRSAAGLANAADFFLARKLGEEG